MRIVQLVLSVIIVGLSVFALVNDSYDEVLLPTVQFGLAALMIIMGVKEFKEGKRPTAYFMFATSAIICLLLLSTIIR